MKVDTAWVHRVATLARLRISEESARRLATELGAVIEYVDALSSADLSGLADTEPAVNPIRRNDTVQTFENESLAAHAAERVGEEVTIHAAVETPS